MALREHITSAPELRKKGTNHLETCSCEQVSIWIQSDATTPVSRYGTGGRSDNLSLTRSPFKHVLSPPSLQISMQIQLCYSFGDSQHSI